jgi:hypothetical protein
MTKRALIAFTASLFLFACGGDDDDGGGETFMCIGSYSSMDNHQFAAAATSGMCVNDSDLVVACAVDLSSIVGLCGAGCYQANPSSTQQELAACTGMCVKNNPATVTDPTDPCLGCYLGSVGCTLQFCSAQCAGGASAPDCVSCRATNNCTSTFYTCSGLPVPPTADGG